jgi:hypothetical protein
MSIKGEGEKEGQWWVEWGSTKLILFMLFFLTLFLYFFKKNVN